MFNTISVVYEPTGYKCYNARDCGFLATNRDGFIAKMNNVIVVSR